MDIREKTQGFSIKNKTACLIGCGGLGCNIAVHLVGAGIGKLYICDYDKVSESNLNRQFLYFENDIGKSKCLTAKKRLSSYSSDTETIAVEKKIENSSDLLSCKDSDIFILAVDNSEARRAVQSFCDKYKKPLVCGGIDGFYGVCYLYLPGKSPCPDCAALNENVKACANVSSAAGVIGSLEAALATKYLLTSDGELSGKLTIYDNGNFDILEIKSSAECRICSKLKENSL